MPLELNKAKIKDYLTQVGSVDSARNVAFESGAQYQLNQDNAEYAKLEAEIADLKAQLAAKTSKKK
jgi:hypothetical protein